MQPKLTDVIRLYNIKVGKYIKQGIEPCEKLLTLLWNEAMAETNASAWTLENYRELCRAVTDFTIALEAVALVESLGEERRQ